jgi:hypothetical protein
MPPQLTNSRADGGFDENHVMVAVSPSVQVVHAYPQALARQANRGPPVKRATGSRKLQSHSVAEQDFVSRVE